MMHIQELMKTTPETLAAQQHKALLKETMATLQVLMSHLSKGDYKAALNMTEESYAGDGNGRDNRCICFNHLLEPIIGEFTDISDVIQRLETLSKHLVKK